MPHEPDALAAAAGLDAELRRAFGAAVRDSLSSRGWGHRELARRLNLRASFIDALLQGRGHEQMDSVYEWSHMRSIASLLDLDIESFA